MIPEEAKEDIRSRLAIEDVIGEYVPLKRAGRSWKGLSPFAQEKTPSFFVSPDKQIWHDFSSNKGGDIFSFVMEVEGLDFRGALEMLARKAGVDLSVYQTTGKGYTQKKQQLFAICETATIFYQRMLINTPVAIDYVSKKRQLTREIVLDFRIGYAPGSGKALIEHLQARGFSLQEIRDAGLVSSRGSDMFRDRMMVPLSDGQGRIVGFTARLLADVKNAPKYINTPQTLLYDKGRQAFGLYQAKEAIRTRDSVVIVEGNLDVVSSHQAGIKNVVAAAGTALTEHHLKALSRLTQHISLCFDGDKAGLAATERAISIAQGMDIELGVINLPDTAKDPDELIKQNAQLWEANVLSPIPAVEWIIQQYSYRYDATTPEGARKISTKALEVIGLLRDPVEKEQYIKKLATTLGVSHEAIKDKLYDVKKSTDRTEQAPLKQPKIPSTSSQDPDVDQDYMLGLAVFDPATHDALRHLKVEDVSGESRKILLGYILSHLGEPIKEPYPIQLRKIETYVKMVLFKAETWSEMITMPNITAVATELVRNIKEQQKDKMKASLDEQLFEARQSRDENKEREILTRINQLIKERKRASK